MSVPPKSPTLRLMGYQRYERLLPSNVDVAELWQFRGAFATEYILFRDPEIDGRVMPLADAVAAAMRGGYGTIISGVVGRLASYYDECGERRMLLERPVG